jgi:hypothetical protein
MRTTSLGNARCVQFVQVIEGWGDIFYVTIRVTGSCVDNRDGLDGKLKSAVATALGEIRHLPKIDWME